MTKAADQLNKLDPRIRNGLVKAYRKLKPHAAVKDLFTRAGYNGMLIELGEERIADVLRETVNLTLEDGYTFEDVLAGISVSQSRSRSFSLSLTVINKGINSHAKACSTSAYCSD